MSKPNPEDLAQKAFELRVNRANAEISKILSEHKLAITSEMVYTPQGIFPKPSLQGIFPKPSFINAPENGNPEEKTEQKQPEQG